MSYGGGHFERKKTLPEYVAQKISMLEDEFYLRLDYADAEVDQFAHQILVDRL